MSFDLTQPTSTPTDDDCVEARPVPDGVTAAFRPSRYERNSGGLPHLGADPEWTPPGPEFVATIIDDEPRGWFRRLWS